MPESCLPFLYMCIFPLFNMLDILKLIVWFLILQSYFFSLSFASLDCTYPLHSSCSHRCPVSQNQSQKSLLFATHLHPLLQHWQKWVGITLCHLQMKPQKMWMKRMSLVTAGVSCLFQMHSHVRGIKLFIALGLSRLMPQMGKYISSSVTRNAVLCRKKLILLYLNITHIPEAWNHLFPVF